MKNQKKRAHSMEEREREEKNEVDKVKEKYSISDRII